MKLNTSHKVLVVRFSSIGDIVLTTPIVRCLKRQTGVTIHYLTKKSYATLLEANPYIDNVHTIEKDIAEITSVLKAEKYDYIIDLHKNLRTWRLKQALGIPRHYFNKINFQKWLLVNLKINYLPPIHIVDRYFDAVAFAGIQNDGQGLDYFIPKDLPMTSTLSFPKKPYVVFAIGAAHATKRLPKEKIVEIIQHINPNVILIGGKTEQKVSQYITANTGAHVEDQCGKLSLHESAWCIQHAAAVITHDTGMMHIAAAFQKKIISIWGNTVPAFGMYPYYSKNVNKNMTVQVEQLSCRPCSKIGHEKCPKGHFRCMQLIDTDAVIQEANRHKD